MVIGSVGADALDGSFQGQIFGEGEGKWSAFSATTPAARRTRSSLNDILLTARDTPT